MRERNREHSLNSGDTGFDSVVFAENCEFTTDCNITGLNNNVLVTGASGSGKTLSFVEANLLRTYHRNLMLVIRKPKMIQKYAHLLRKRGYRVDILDFCRPSQCTVAFDMLQYVKSYQDAIYQARSIVMADPQKKDSKADPYWDEAAIALVTALILITILTRPHQWLAALVLSFLLGDGDSFLLPLEQVFPLQLSHGTENGQDKPPAGSGGVQRFLL